VFDEATVTGLADQGVANRLGRLGRRIEIAA
jgi:hypothetical protein